jgi:TPR repeat protein
LAETGDAAAQFRLGSMYHHGKGVPQDDAEAVKWYHKAAVQGNTDAQNNLDQMKAEGIKVDKTESKPTAQKLPNQGQSMTQWWYADKGINKGPVETEELKKLLQIGKINLKTLVW